MQICCRKQNSSDIFQMFFLFKVALLAVVAVSTFFAVRHAMHKHKQDSIAKMYHLKTADFVLDVAQQIFEHRKEENRYINLHEMNKQVGEMFREHPLPTDKMTEKATGIFQQRLLQEIYNNVKNDRCSNDEADKIVKASKRIRLLLVYPNFGVAAQEFQIHLYLLKRLEEDKENLTKSISLYEAAKKSATLASLESTFIISSNQKLKKAIRTLNDIRSVAQENKHSVFLSRLGLDALSLATMCNTGYRAAIRYFQDVKIPYLSSAIERRLRSGLVFLNNHQLDVFFKTMERTRQQLEQIGKTYDEAFYSSHPHFTRTGASFAYEIEILMAQIFALCYRSSLYKRLSQGNGVPSKPHLREIDTKEFPERGQFALYTPDIFEPITKQSPIEDPFQALRNPKRTKSSENTDS